MREIIFLSVIIIFEFTGLYFIDSFNAGALNGDNVGLRSVKARLGQRVWTTTPRGTVNQELKLSTTHLVELVRMIKFRRCRRLGPISIMALNPVYEI